MADGSITFSTALDNKQLEKDVKTAEKEVKKLEKALEQDNGKKSGIETQMQNAQAEIDKTATKIERLRALLAELEAVQPENAEEWHGAQREIPGVRQAIDEELAKTKQQQKEQAKLNTQLEAANSKAKDHATQLEAAKNKAAGLSKEYAKVQSAAAKADSGSKFNASMSKALKSVDQFGKRLRSLLGKVFVFGVFSHAIRVLSGFINDALQSNQAFSASWAYLQGTVVGVANAIATILAPIIISVITMAANGITALAQLIDNIFGTGIVGSIAAARQAAESTWRQGDQATKANKANNKSASASKKATKATKDQTKATKDLTKAQKEATESVMAFDEINTLSAQDMENAADAAGADAGSMPDVGGIGEGEGGGGLKPNWDAFDVGKISEVLGEIMIVLGASLMAVGAILCFSGINIPLGITLMAIGALMVYTAYQEVWDKLPQEVRDAISGVLIVSGIALLAIGAVLAFSGANIPLGVGMMVAGALLLWTAAALNWESLTEPVKVAISAIMTALSGALMAVGAILALSGANVPLGIALMAVGAASLAGVAAINWGDMPQQVQQVTAAIMQGLSGALLAVGAIIALSGGSIPLGIGLMIAGAVMLASSAALNWGEVSSSVDNVIKTIEKVVGGAALALGALLVLSGTNIPLGFSILALGAATLASATAINWDDVPANVRNDISALSIFLGGALLVIGVILACAGVTLPLALALIAAGASSLVFGTSNLDWNYVFNKVQEVWQNIENYWRTNIEPCFTADFWYGVFKSIVNGLISAANAGLGVVEDFVNGLGSGIASVAGALGLSVSVPHVYVPNIPYLAQGAVIPPNRQFMAVLGDQRSGNNIEAPEALLRQVVSEEAGRIVADAIMAINATQAQNSVGGGDITLTLAVDGEELAKAVDSGHASLTRRGLIKPNVDLAFL